MRIEKVDQLKTTKNNHVTVTTEMRMLNYRGMVRDIIAMNATAIVAAPDTKK